MRYAIFCYHAESQACSLPKDKDEVMMAGIGKAKDEISKTAKFGPVARLMPTTAAMTVREGRELVVLDGPFAETKEQLLGFYIIECDTLDEAIEAARKLAEPRAAAGLNGALEIRPLRMFDPGQPMEAM